MVTVKMGDITQVLASLNGRAGNAGDIDIGSYDRTRVVLNLVVFQAILSLLLLPSFLVGGLAILPKRKRCGCEEC